MTMQSLTRESLTSFMHRFESFNDGLIRSVEYRYIAAGARKAVITASVMDHLQAQGWSNVVLTIDEVTEIKLWEDRRTSCQVLSGGLKVDWFDGVAFLSFSLSIADPTSVEHFRESEFYVAGRSVLWYATAYDDK